MRNLFVKAATDHEVFEAIVFTTRKVSDAINSLVRTGFIFDVDNNVIRFGELSGKDVEKLDRAIKGILYLHSVSPLWTGRKTLSSVGDKAKFIAEFNILLNEAVAKAV